MRTAASLCVVLLSVAGCQPMYGTRAPKLPDPPRKAQPVTQIEKPVPLVYIDKCDHDFRRPLPARGLKAIVRDTPGAASAVRLADTKVAAADLPITPAKADLLVDGVATYSTALRRDPYDAEATLKLAVVYDRLQRKGCALALLKRLTALASNTTFAVSARKQSDAVNDHAEWFKDYRSEALAQLP